jgi:hypothetical protein
MEKERRGRDGGSDAYLINVEPLMAAARRQTKANR